MNNFRTELHVAQQSRRDKLRIQQVTNTPPDGLGIYSHTLEQFPAHDNINYESSHLRFQRHTGNSCPDSSETFDFAANSHYLLRHQESEKWVGGESSSFGNVFNPPVTINCDPHYFSTWKSIGSQSSNDWVATNQTQTFVRDSLSGPPPKIVNSSYKSKPYLDYQDLDSNLNNHNSQKNFKDASSGSLHYRNGLQGIVGSSNEMDPIRQTGCEETNHGSWLVGGGVTSDLINRPSDYSARNNNTDGGLGIMANDNSNTRALSLSLSSIPSPKVHATQVAERGNFVNLCQGNIQDFTHRDLGPLGPFTGYATILRSSKYLRPAQQLMDDLCSVARPNNHGEIFEGSDKILEQVRVSFDDVGDHVEHEGSRELGEIRRPNDSYPPENLQKKAKLLCMQDEVCKRYKQYQQQMQMAVSSFESVAGLSSAAPCISLALKMVSKHFRFLKNAITDQLKSIRSALGEEFSSSVPRTSSSKGHDPGTLMLKFFDQSFQNHKTGGNQDIGESHNVWRPQRGLPERAVSVLRAWLFDHFLHPYPTDTDKHMLAAQTGLTRNQVSNWFINARVRVWKPMVEEIHMLETNQVAGKELNSGKSNDVRSSNNQVECSRNRNIPQESGAAISNSSTWNQEKRSRVEYHVPENSDTLSRGFGPGPVSLTLGLMQSGPQYFRGQIFRDFVG